jgi:hypothetical protein
MNVLEVTPNHPTLGNGVIFGKEPIRTLGLYQPYAELMMHGKIETRWIKKGTKPPFPKGKYLLYACKKEYTLTQLSVIAGNQYNRITTIINGLDLIRGAAIAVGDLVKHIYIVPGMEDETFVRYQPPLSKVMVGLIFENVKRIKPFPFKGKQGVGFLSKEDERKIEFV